jgi:hypothetical protein
MSGQPFELGLQSVGMALERNDDAVVLGTEAIQIPAGARQQQIQRSDSSCAAKHGWFNEK